jgi:hypothetical protein
LTLLPGDFSLPYHDVQDINDLEVRLESLELLDDAISVPEEPVTGDDSTPMSDITENLEIKNYSAMMKFSVTWRNGTREMDFTLKHDVHFVTAHPCVPSKHTKLLQSPTSPSTQNIIQPSEFEGSQVGPHERYTGKFYPWNASCSLLIYAGHPLHKSFVYKREFFSHILIPSLIRRDSLSQHPLESLHTSSNEVFVIDCTEPAPPSTTPPLKPTDLNEHTSNTFTEGPVTRKRRFGSDLEMMARAWCTEMGYNALISRKGRNCIACSIREARALGWKIVLRFG